MPTVGWLKIHANPGAVNCKARTPRSETNFKNTGILIDADGAWHPGAVCGTPSYKNKVNE